MEGEVPFNTKVNEVAMEMKRTHIQEDHKEAPKKLHEVIGVCPTELQMFLKVAALFMCNKVDATLGHIYKPYQDKVNQYFKRAMFNLCDDLKLMDKANKKACDITEITYTPENFKKLFVQLRSEAGFTGLCMSSMIHELCVYSLEEENKELFKFIELIDEQYHDRCD